MCIYTICIYTFINFVSKHADVSLGHARGSRDTWSSSVRMQVLCARFGSGFLPLYSRLWLNKIGVLSSVPEPRLLNFLRAQRLQLWASGRQPRAQ